MLRLALVRGVHAYNIPKERDRQVQSFPGLVAWRYNVHSPNQNVKESVSLPEYEGQDILQQLVRVRQV